MTVRRMGVTGKRLKGEGSGRSTLEDVWGSLGHVLFYYALWFPLSRLSSLEEKLRAAVTTFRACRLEVPKFTGPAAPFSGEKKTRHNTIGI